MTPAYYTTVDTPAFNFLVNRLSDLIFEFSKTPSKTLFNSIQNHYHAMHMFHHRWCFENEQRWFAYTIVEEQYRELLEIEREAERQRLIEAMKATPGINNLFHP